MESTAFRPLPVHYDIAVVRMLEPTTPAQRAKLLAEVHYNTDLIAPRYVYVDLKTDSGVSALSEGQLMASVGVGSADPRAELSRDGHAVYSSLATRFRELTGFPFVVACSAGRAAERVLTKLCVRPDTVVPANMLFISTRGHIESTGAKLVDVSSESAWDLTSDEPFKGNVDLGKLERAIAEHGARGLSCSYLELAVNSCGGHPISIANLREVRARLRQHGVPLFLDASRILENAFWVREREPDWRNRTIREVVQAILAECDGATFSAMKDFLVRDGGFLAVRDESLFRAANLQIFRDGAQPSTAALAALDASLAENHDLDSHVESRVELVRDLWLRLTKSGVPVLRPAAGHAVYLDVRAFLPNIPPEGSPADALCAFLYELSGVRVVKGPPPSAEQSRRGVELLRLAIPARRYLATHIEYVADAVAYAFRERDRIVPLRRVGKPEIGIPARFDKVEAS
jgi:tyrosine phenol-lyase